MRKANQERSEVLPVLRYGGGRAWVYTARQRRLAGLRAEQQQWARRRADISGKRQSLHESLRAPVAGWMERRVAACPRQWERQDSRGNTNAAGQRRQGGSKRSVRKLPAYCGAVQMSDMAHVGVAARTCPCGFCCARKSRHAQMKKAAIRPHRIWSQGLSMQARRDRKGGSVMRQIGCCSS